MKKRSEGAQKLTKKLVAEQALTIFQTVFATDKFLIATDVLRQNDLTQKYDIYEIKISSIELNNSNDSNNDNEEKRKSKRVNNRKELQYEYDLAFQVGVLKMCGVSIGKKYLIRLNREYIREGDLDFRPNQFFVVEDKTEKIDFLEAEIEREMNKAYNYLIDGNLSGPCPCYYKGRSSHCTTFSYINPIVPNYSVHELNRIGNSKKYLTELLDEGILEIGDVPEDDRLKPKEKQNQNGKDPALSKKLNQVRVYKSQKPPIDIKAIKRELDSLSFPLYFLDYETYPAPIPLYDNYHPYQQIVFQYSLHILKSKSSEPLHFEKIVLGGEPSKQIAEGLHNHIGNKGTIISWYKAFENSRNRELAELLPNYKDFFYNIIARTYDLMDIFEKQYFVHPGFQGRSSIKKVLPVMASDLSYESLRVKNGINAMDTYGQIIKGELIGKEKSEKEKDML